MILVSILSSAVAEKLVVTYQTRRKVSSESSSFYFLHLFTRPFFDIRLEQSKQTQQTLISKQM